MAEKQIYTFTNEIDEVEVSALGARITVLSTDAESITAEYDNPSDKPEFCAVLSGKRVTLRENFKFNLIGSKLNEGAVITVRLPKKLYKSLKIKTASGGCDITDTAVTAENFTLNTASGDINICAFFEDIKVKSASGSVTIENPTAKTAQRLSVTAASGTITVKGYGAEKFSISSVSGKTTYTGARGNGEINVTSGGVEVGYVDWSGDLKIGAVSGNVEVKLPEGSGANIKFDGVSGMVRTDLGGEPGKFMNLGKGTNGEFGGSNKHNIAVNLVSGKVTVAAAGGSAELLTEK